MPPTRWTTPDRYLSADPSRLREMADWLDRTDSPGMAAAARRAAADLESSTQEVRGAGTGAAASGAAGRPPC